MKVRILTLLSILCITGIITGCSNPEYFGDTITIVGSNNSSQVISRDTLSDNTLNLEYTDDEFNTQHEYIEEQILIEDSARFKIDKLDSESTLEFIDTLNKLDEAAWKYEYTVLDELKYIRSSHYNSIYWGELMGYDDLEMNNLLEEYDSSISSLRDDQLLKIGDTDYTIQVAHMFATLNCMKEGLGSLGGWKGDICELVESLDPSLDADTVYTKAYLSFSETNTKFNIYDVYSDICAVNIAKTLSLNGDLSDCVEQYFIDIQTYNPFAMFIRNEFNITTRNNNLLYESLYNSMNSDILVRYLMRIMHIEARSQHLASVCRAFADFIFDNITDEELIKLNELYTIEYTDNIHKIEHELSIKNKSKAKELMSKFIADGGKEKIDEFISTAKGYFSN